MNKVVTGIELRVPVTSTKGTLLGHRVYDSVTQSGSLIARVEAKSWSPQYIIQNVRNSLRGRKVVTELGEEVEEKGQMLLDMVDMFKNRSNSNFIVEWKFDRRMLEADREKLIEMLRKEFDPDSPGKLTNDLFDKLGLDPNIPSDKIAWKQFLGSMQAKIPNMISRVDNQFN